MYQQMKMDVFKKFKKSIKAFIDAWKEKPKVETKRIDHFLEALDAVHENAKLLSELEMISDEAKKGYGKIIDPFFDRVTRFVMPEYLIDMYRDDKTPIPNLEVFIHQFRDIKEMKTGQDIRIIFHKKIIGHIIITSWSEADRLKTDVEEKFAIDKSPGEIYKIKNPE